MDFDINIVKYSKCRGLFLRERRRRKTRGLARTEFYTIWFWAALVGSGVFCKIIYPDVQICRNAYRCSLLYLPSIYLCKSQYRANAFHRVQAVINKREFTILYSMATNPSLLPYCCQTEEVYMVGAPVNVSSLKLTTPGLPPLSHLLS